MQLRKLHEGEWKQYACWYEAKGDSMDQRFVPRNTGYLVLSDAHIPAAMGFLICTNSDSCFMEYLSTNPALPEFIQSKALILLAKSLERIAHEVFDYKLVIGMTPEDHFSLAQLYERHGAYRGKKLFRLFYKLLGGGE